MEPVKEEEKKEKKPGLWDSLKARWANAKKPLPSLRDKALRQQLADAGVEE